MASPVAGLSTTEIARALLVSESTLSQRLLRTKQKIANAGIPYRVPPAHLLPERVPGVLGVLYLLFNEGYSATAGADLIRQNLSAEAIRLARVLDRLMPDEPEAAGLLALMLMHDARRADHGIAARKELREMLEGNFPAIESWQWEEIARAVFTDQPSVEVDTFDGLLVEYARKRRASSRTSSRCET